MRRIMLTAAVMAGLLLPAPARAATTVPVFMSNLKFCSTPACVTNENTTVSLGDTVVWVYADGLCTALAVLGCFHTATRTATPAFNSGPMPGPGGAGSKVTFQWVPPARGTYSYFCNVHGSSMSASIIVR